LASGEHVTGGLVAARRLVAARGRLAAHGWVGGPRGVGGTRYPPEKCTPPVHHA